MNKPRPRKRKLPPFFDNIDNPEFHHFPQGIAVDGTPLPPDLSPFDRKVLQVCGSVGSRPHPDDFRALFRAHPEILQQIQIAVDGEIFPGRSADSEFLEIGRASCRERVLMPV